FEAAFELSNPLPDDEATIARGARLFAIYCTPCHGEAGDGAGPVVGPNRIPPTPLLNLLSERAAALSERIREDHGEHVAQYAVPFAFNIRFVMDVNARQAFHLIELRSQPAGHIAYRRIAHEMHRQIAEVAGHRAVADAMRFVDRSGVDLERLESERRAAERRRRAGTSAT
ncbi:MAG: FAD-dependent thymidylate synthase, partial [Acidimicrobiia bacterium]|nr:FAD-dependent thymidylate synthase [Acidimicrobiia bacterium]